MGWKSRPTAGDNATGKVRGMRSTCRCLLVVILFALTAVHARTPGEVAVGEQLREAPLQGLFGPNRKLSDFRGKPLMINVWASWCGPCQQEMGSIEELSRRFSGKQFNVIGISTDDYSERATLFLMKTGTTFNNFIDSGLILENMLGASHLPLTVLVDAHGRVLAKHYGAKDWRSPQSVALIAKTLRVKLALD